MNTIITLDTSKGKVNFKIVVAFEIDGLSYIALSPETSISPEIVLYRYVELKEDSIQLINIENDDEYQKAMNKFNSIITQAETEDEKDE